MDLLLVRCTDTQKSDEDDGNEGFDQPLSLRGRNEAERLGAWVRAQGIRGLRVVSSPAPGARELAAMVSDHPEVSRRLGKEANTADVLDVAGWPDDHRAVMIIAHQPVLGSLASLLLAGHEAPWTFKKGSLWWFSNRSRSGESQTILRCVLTPGLIKGGGIQARTATPREFK